MSERKQEARGAGLLAALLMAAALWYTLFSAPALEVTGDGGYTATLERLALTPLFETDGGSYPAKGEYAIGAYEYALLLRPETPFLDCAVAAARLPLALMGRPFTVRALAWVYIALISLAIGLAVAGLWRFGRLPAYGVGGGMMLLMMHNGITGYLCSLYHMGAAVAALVLFFGCSVYAFCQPRGAGTRFALAVAACGALALRVKAQMIVLMPCVALTAVLAALHLCPAKPRRLLHWLACGMALALLITGGVTVYQQSKDVHSDAANYLAVFQGYLSAAEQPAQTLEQLGLDESFLPDIGKSYYGEEDSFAHNPRAEDADWMEKLSSGNRLRYCLTHPSVVFRAIESMREHLYDPYNGRIAAETGQTRYVRPSPWLLVLLLVRQESFARHIGLMALAAGLCALASILHGLKSGAGKGFAALAAFYLCGMAYLPACVAFTGFSTFDMDKVLFFLLGWSGLFVAIGALAEILTRVCAWLGESAGALRPSVLPAAPYAPLRRFPDHSVAVCVCLSLLLVGMTLLPGVHVGGVNNGDFGRMMKQLDLYWLPEQLEHDEQQLAYAVMEHYDYLTPFHPARLTPLDPTYSLIYPSMPVRLASAITGQPYSTQLQALVLAAVILACLISLIRDLRGVLGRVVVLPAVLLTLMVFGENHVAWYNSLFGESTVIAGLMMLLAGSVHLIVMPRGGWRWAPWVLLAAFGARFAICSKAQMVLALPGALCLLIALALYHRPQGARRVAAFAAALTLLCGWVCWDALGIFQKNSQESDRHTVWQSVFSGVLLVTDDPSAAMEELGIDSALSADIGKHAFEDEDTYAYDFYSEKMDEAFFDHVGTMDVVKFYLTHPKELYFMLNRAAEQSVELPTGFMAYTDELYSESKGIHRAGVWRAIRPLFAGRSFLWYVAVYGTVLILCARTMLRKDEDARKRLFALMFVCVMAIGVFQYPLTVVGNGFIDNNKQLYGFMVCHDFLVIGVFSAAARWLMTRVRREEARISAKEGEA